MDTLKELNSWQVIIPKWEWYYEKSKKTNPKYWLWKDKDKLPAKYNKDLMGFKVFGSKVYCIDRNNERFLKNTNKVGKPNRWVVNGQGLYSGTLNWRLRKAIAKYYHEYFSSYIKEQLDIIPAVEGYYLSVSCDIYIKQRGNMPDASNMWPLEKFFEDALQECGIIEDDSPNYVRESGRKRYHFIEDDEERKLVFTIKYIK